MHHLIALLAGCLLYPPPEDPCREAREAQYEFLRSHGGPDVEWNANGTVKHMKAAGIFLRPGIADLKVEDAAPQILEAIGPALLARGTEELRVRDMFRDLQTPRELTLKLNQFIAGREVRWAYVNVVVIEQTNELKEIWAGFMPDRGLDHEPRLSADEARAKAMATIKESFNRSQGRAARYVLLSDAPPSDLLYEFEEVGATALLGGALVWVFSAGDGEYGYRVNVDAATGKVISVYPVNRF